MKSGEILEAGEFALVKEYLEAEATISGISSVTGLSQKVVRDIDEAPHYKAYLENLKKIHRDKIKGETNLEKDNQTLIKIIENLTEQLIKINDRLDKIEEYMQPKFTFFNRRH